MRFDHHGACVYDTKHVRSPTKTSPKDLFYRHVDYIMGHVPPHYSVFYSEVLSLDVSPEASAATKLTIPYEYYIRVNSFACNIHHHEHVHSFYVFAHQDEQSRGGVIST